MKVIAWTAVAVLAAVASLHPAMLLGLAGFIWPG